jgi:hypothetical protein
VERATIAFPEEPQTVEEALNGENAKKWEMAMQEEYDSQQHLVLVATLQGYEAHLLQMGVQNQTWG